MRDREEPTMGDPADLEFRPQAYRGPASPRQSEKEEFQTWKIGIAVGIAVFAALLLFNMYERHQDRKDAELAMRDLEATIKKMEADTAREAAAARAEIWGEVRRNTQTPRNPLRDGERCIKGERFRRVQNGWVQLPHDPCY